VIPDEPVCGRTPPPWFRALSGIERHRAFSRGLLPWPPFARLLGTSTTHVAAGTVTVVMPASDVCLALNGQLEIVPVMVAAFDGASQTALPAGVDTIPMRFTCKAFRPVWQSKGNLVARARGERQQPLRVRRGAGGGSRRAPRRPGLAALGGATGRSALRFIDRGERQLKGVPDPWRLYAVAE